MTRINAGIHVEDLCDQHLLSEYRELPRMVAFTWRIGDNVPDRDFTLNTGHMWSCARYGAYLAIRHQGIVTELRYRGFRPCFIALTPTDFPAYAQRYPSQAWLDMAMRIARVRIIERLRRMKRVPMWSKRTRPLWTGT